METDPDAGLTRYASANGQVVNGSCMSALLASSLPAAAANRSAASRTVEEPFDNDHWVFDTGTHFDMCPSDTIGIRTKRTDLGTIITANGLAFPDHTQSLPVSTLSGRRPSASLSKDYPSNCCRSVVDAAYTVPGLPGSRLLKCPDTPRLKEP